MPEPDSTNHADMPPPMPFESLLRMLLNSISRYRPDLQCLLTLPLEYSNGIGAPTISQRALTLIENLRNNANRHLLRHVQFLFPYLRGLRHRLYSPSGTIAGKQALIVRTKGPWHSVSGQPLQTESHPYPSLTLSQIVALRDNPGIGILRQQSDTFGNSQICLDDERLAVPALPLSDYVLSEDQSKFNGYRAAEIMRFLGYLRRQLKSFGEQLVFSVDTNDHRPRILLERFFRQLYNKGALRGAIPEEAYQIEQTSPNETTVQYDVQISPAFPIDKIIITFINVNGEWQGTVGNG